MSFCDRHLENILVVCIAWLRWSHRHLGLLSYPALRMVLVRERACNRLMLGIWLYYLTYAIEKPINPHEKPIVLTHYDHYTHCFSWTLPSDLLIHAPSPWILKTDMWRRCPLYKQVSKVCSRVSQRWLTVTIDRFIINLKNCEQSRETNDRSGKDILQFLWSTRGYR